MPETVPKLRFGPALHVWYSRVPRIRLCDLLFVIVLICVGGWRMPGPRPDCPAFYRFGKRYTGDGDQSALPNAVHRILPSLVTGQAEQPTRLRPLWLDRGGVRPWGRGAAGPHSSCDEEAAHPRRLRRRGVRAGRRHQLRRHRHDRGGAVRAGQDGAMPRCLASPVRLGAVGAIPVVAVGRGRAGSRRCAAERSAPLQRHLLVPARLTLRRTGLAETRARESAARTLKVAHLNVRSLTAHMDEVNHLMRTERLDVLCLSETFLSRSVDSCMLVFPGYAICRRDRPTGRSGGGVAVLHRTALTVERLRVPATQSALESLWLQVAGRSSIIIGTVYRPPNCPAAAALDDLHRQLTSVLARGRPTYMIGDTNFDVLRPSKPGVTPYIQLLSDLALTQMVTEPTRPGESPSLLDHLVASRPELASEVAVTACNISDHDLVTARVADVRQPFVPETITVRSTRRVDQDALCLDLLLADWSSVYETDSITNMWNGFLNTWRPIIDRHMPLRTIKIRNRCYPWLEDETVREAMAARDAARWDRDHTPCEETRREFRERRNAVKMALNTASAAYFSTSFRNGRGLTWKHIRRYLVTSKKNERRAASGPTDDPDWPNKLNQFFASVGPDVAQALAARDTSQPLPPRPPRVCSGAFSPRPATLPELSAALQRMSSSRACGPDGITMEMLRTTFPVVGPHLLKLVNTCIVQCALPRDWKVATVVPLHKKGDQSDPNNYRPISILPVVSKLCERTVCMQLMSYLSEHHLFCPQQYGFRPGLSTEAALLDAVSYTVNNIDKGLVTSLVTADTSKAFDSVEHGRLLDKLGWYGIDCRWFAAWLEGRTQAVIGAHDAMDVTHGVIQGSILGPILFTIFMSDLPQHMPNSKLVLYADDVQFYDADSPSALHLLKDRVDATLATLLTWFTQNRLKINPSKTELIVLKSRRQTADTDFTVSFGDEEISPSDSVKILGVTVDRHLTWSSHVASVVRRCNMILIGLARLRHKLPKCTKQLLVQALVFPHIRYCLTVWGSCSVSLKTRIQKVINFGVRIVSGLARRDHVSTALNELGWSTVDEMLLERDVAIVRHLLSDSCDAPIITAQLLHRSDVSQRQTRAVTSGQLQLPRVRTEFARRSFMYRAVAAWNSVSASG